MENCENIKTSNGNDNVCAENGAGQPQPGILEANCPEHIYGQPYLNAVPAINSAGQLGGNYISMPFPEPWGPMGFNQAFLHPGPLAQPIMMVSPDAGMMLNQQQRDIPWQLAYSRRTTPLPDHHLFTPTPLSQFSGDNDSMVHTPTTSLASYETGRRMSMCSSSHIGSSNGGAPVAARTRSAIKQRSSLHPGLLMSGGAESISSMDTSINSVVGVRRGRKRSYGNGSNPPTPKVMAMSITSQDENQIILEEITPRIHDQLEQKRMTRSQAHKMKEMMRKKPEMWKEGLKHPRPGCETLPVMPQAPDPQGLWPCPRCFKRMKSERLLRQHLAFHARANSLSPKKK